MHSEVQRKAEFGFTPKFHLYQPCQDIAAAASAKLPWSFTTSPMNFEFPSRQYSINYPSNLCQRRPWRLKRQKLMTLHGFQCRLAILFLCQQLKKHKFEKCTTREFVLIARLRSRVCHNNFHVADCAANEKHQPLQTAPSTEPSPPHLYAANNSIL